VLQLEPFFAELDAGWTPPPERVRLPIIGSTALMLQTSYQRGTKDSDVLETTGLATEIQERLLGLAGPDTSIQARHRIYLDIVRNGIPFLPQVPTWHPVRALAALAHFEVVVLDVTDVVVSKLKRYIARDVEDIQAMVERDLVPHALLIDRFRAAVEAFSMDARADDLPKFVRHLNQVERDLFAVDETPIELPAWIGNG
jgi:hypothetical protein